MTPEEKKAHLDWLRSRVKLPEGAQEVTLTSDQLENIMLQTAVRIRHSRAVKDAAFQDFKKKLLT